jgi:hypothetical protein
MEQGRKHADESFTRFTCILLQEMKDFILGTMMQKDIYNKTVGTHAEFTD